LFEFIFGRFSPAKRSGFFKKSKKIIQKWLTVHAMSEFVQVLDSSDKLWSGVSLPLQLMATLPYINFDGDSFLLFHKGPNPNDDY